MRETRERNFPPRLATWVAAVIAAAAVTGGSSHRDAHAQGTGVLLVSTSADTLCYPITMITLRSEGQIFKLLKETVEINGPGTKSAFANYHGNVRALTIEPGDYFLSIEVKSPSQYYNNSRLSGIQVKPEEIRYIGDFAIQGCRNVRLTIANKWGQVRAKFLETYPTLDVRRVKIDPIKRDGS